MTLETDESYMDACSPLGYTVRQKKPRVDVFTTAPPTSVCRQALRLPNHPPEKHVCHLLVSAPSRRMHIGISTKAHPQEPQCIYWQFIGRFKSTLVNWHLRQAMQPCPAKFCSFCQCCSLQNILHFFLKDPFLFGRQVSLLAKQASWKCDSHNKNKIRNMQNRQHSDTRFTNNIVIATAM